jgi:prepilin-type processing-associated H-X9-DG protein
MVELLVVIGIAGVLIGMLATALSNVAAGSRSARCQLNLRQMAVAAQNYAATFDWFPPAIRYENVGGVFHNVAWDWVTTFSNQVVSPGSLWSFTDQPDSVQQCPEFTGSSSFGEPHSGYNYNTTYIGGESKFPNVGWDQFRPGVGPHACRRSARCAMFGDGGWKMGANKYMRAPLNTEGSLTTIYTGGQAFRHGHATNIVFVDGHAGTADDPCQGQLATPQSLDLMDFPRNGFLSDDDGAYDPR